MTNKQLESLIIDKLTGKTTKIIDGQEVTVTYSREEKHVYSLINHTAFIHFKKISGNTAYTMAVRILKYLKKYNI
jgi:nicotinamide mononucleotide (NMN) deamidase PncC